MVRFIQFLTALFIVIPGNSSAAEVLLWSKADGRGSLFPLTHKDMTCTPTIIAKDLISLRVIEHNSRASQLNMENLLLTPQLSEDEKNTKAKIPSGAVVKIKNFRGNYAQVELISVPSGQQDSVSIAKVGDRGYVHRSSTRPLDDYLFYLGENFYTQNLKQNQKVDLQQSVLNISRNKNGDIQAVRCCDHSNACLGALVFDVIDLDSKSSQPKMTLAIPVMGQQSGLFESAMAFIPNVDHKEVDDKRATRIKAGAPAAKITPVRNSALISKPATAKNNVPVKIEGFYENVVCLSRANNRLRVRDEHSNKFLFWLQNGDRIKIFQGWNGGEPEERVVNGEVYSYLKIQDVASGKIGWAPSRFLKQASECKSLSLKKNIITQTTTPDVMSNQPPQTEGTPKSTTKNNPMENYTFPTLTSTGFSYIETETRPHQDQRLLPFIGYNYSWGIFGAGRSQDSRAHAATDLYQARGQTPPNATYSHEYFGGPFRAITDGKVIRGATYFYMGTSSIVVHHDDGVVSRYGEIYNSTTYRDTRVRSGDVLGYIKWVGMNTVPPMLHFENYYPNDNKVKSGALLGDKKINGLNTKRSQHLFDRTPFIKNLERVWFAH